MNQKEAVLCYPPSFSFPSCPVGMFRQRKQRPCPLDLCTSGRHIQEYNKTSCACKRFYNRQPDGEKGTAISFEDAVLCDPACQQEKPWTHPSSSPWPEAEFWPLQAILAKWEARRCLAGSGTGAMAWRRHLAVSGAFPSRPVTKHRGSVSSSAAMHAACGVPH